MEPQTAQATQGLPDCTQTIGFGEWAPWLAVFVAILALLWQVWSVRRQLKIQNFSDYTKRYQEIVLHFPEDVNEQTFTLDPKDQEKYRLTMRYMRAYFDLCFEEFFLHRKRLISKDIWSIWEKGMTFAFRKPAFKQAWAIIRQDTEYGDAFEKFVDATMQP